MQAQTNKESKFTTAVTSYAVWYKGNGIAKRQKRCNRTATPISHSHSSDTHVPCRNRVNPEATSTISLERLLRRKNNVAFRSYITAMLQPDARASSSDRSFKFA